MQKISFFFMILTLIGCATLVKQPLASGRGTEEQVTTRTTNPSPSNPVGLSENLSTQAWLPLVTKEQPWAYKWDLWSRGTQLRGANIWQRVRVPSLDQDYLGDGYIGPPYSQADFDRLAQLGANYVNLSLPGLFTITDRKSVV